MLQLMNTPTEARLAESIITLKSAVGACPGAWIVHAQIAELSQKATRDGKPFFEALLVDATDSFTLRVWSDHQSYAEVARLGQGRFIQIQGHFEMSPRFGLEARSWTARELSSDERELLLAGPPDLRRKQEQDFQEILRLATSLHDPRFAALATLFLERHGERFRRTAAARSYHHARRGGLVEHVARMMKSAEALCSVYPELNRDLLLAGCLFHDCGKLFENCYEQDGFQMPVTKLGELLGHIPVGIELVNSLWHDAAERYGSSWNELKPHSDEVRLHLLHLVAAHHGEYEFGSPTLPRTPEAVALHYIDNLDAKLEMFSSGYPSSPMLAPGIFERVRPLPATLVAPLPAFDNAASEKGERVHVNDDANIFRAVEPGEAGA